jgi:hypothetical protein
VLLLGGGGYLTGLKMQVDRGQQNQYGFRYNWEPLKNWTGNDVHDVKCPSSKRQNDSIMRKKRGAPAISEIELFTAPCLVT